MLDLVMPDLDGMGVLVRMRASGDTRPVVVQTAHGSIETVISAMRAGAFDFVVKPVGVERLAVSIKNALKTGALEDEIRLIKRHKSARSASGSRQPQPAIWSAPSASGSGRASRNIPVLIEGKSGVGKELLARAIQGSSRPPGEAVRHGELRGDPREPRRVDAVRP